MLVLILTNYVMLNLFVGMIINNFAYISAKDGNGAVEDEHFIDAAHKLSSLACGTWLIGPATGMQFRNFLVSGQPSVVRA